MENNRAMRYHGEWTTKAKEALMKHLVMIGALILLLVSPVFGQFRIDLGADMPITVGTITGSGVTTSSEVAEFLSIYHFPFPEAGFYYQFSIGPLRLAPGVRIFTFILESILWPNLMAELQLGPVFIDAQVGGLLFGFFGLANAFEYGEVFFPDVSVWFGFGKKKNFRVGAGVLGMIIPELTTEGMLIIPYAGLKVSLLME
jgi:hypothetical protein